MFDIPLLTCLHLVATTLPGAATATAARRRGVVDPVTLIAVAFAAGGLFAYLSFWIFFADRDLGIAFSIAVPLASLIYLAAAIPDVRDPDEPLRRLAQPLLLWIFGVIFILSLGFLHGGSDGVLGMSATRFNGQLPSDNDLPRYFAHQFFEGKSLTPPSPYPGDWLSSDRPPLQAGYVLTQMFFGSSWDAISYQIHGVILQQTWIIGLWALLTAAGLSRRTRALTLIAALVTDVTIVHGFFVWPKLLPATFLLLALALVFSPQWPELRRDYRAAVLVATLLALALLSHGAAIFGIVPILLLGLLRGAPNLRWIAVAGLTGLLFMGSWVTYQRAVDPPGDRLVKWHLGGATEVTEKGTLTAIVDGYAEAGFSGVVDNKLSNLSEVTGARWLRDVSPIVDAIGAGDLQLAVEKIRSARFFSTLLALGLLALAPLVMLFGARRKRSLEAQREWRFAVCCLGLAVAGILAWIALEFGGPSVNTSIHVGSLSLNLMLVAGAVAGMMSVAPRLALGVVVANAVTVLVLYVPSFKPVEGTSYSPVAALCTAIGIAGFIAVARREQGGDRKPGPAPQRSASPASIS